MAEHNELGKKGEDEAVAFLRQKGYRILERNYRFHKSEIDIIAQIDQTLVAVEVKTRSSAIFGDPQDFVKPKQIRRLVEALDHYIVERQLDFEVRFDVIGIVKNQHNIHIEHLKDAFFFFE